MALYKQPTPWELRQEKLWEQQRQAEREKVLQKAYAVGFTRQQVEFMEELFAPSDHSHAPSLRDMRF